MNIRGRLDSRRGGDRGGRALRFGRHGHGRGRPVRRSLSRMRVSSGLRVLSIALAAASVAWLAGPAAAAAPEPVPVPGRLLPVPAAPPGGSVSTVATDVTPLGVVGGTSTVTAYDAEGVQTVVFRPQRWASLPRVGWLRQG